MSQTAVDSNVDREALVARLESSRERFLKAVHGVTERQSEIRAAADCWSIRDVAEHVALAEKGLLSRLKAGEPNPDPPNYEVDATLQSGALDRSQKRLAPEAVRPAGHFASLGQALAAFKQSRQESIEYIASYPGDFRKVKGRTSAGQLDGYQLVLLLALHCERHAAHIDEIQNQPSYLR